MKRLVNWLMVALLMSGSGACFAQSVNSGDVRGTVTDTSGAVVPNVTVSVFNVDTGVSKDFVTNNDGVFDTSSIVIGNYKLTFSGQGYEKLVRGPITLQVGFTTVNAQLKVGSTNQEVTVSADVPLLETESGEQSTTLDSKSMSQLPQVTQDWENFMILLPGASGAVGASQGSANPGQEVAINGNLPYSNILADGASTTLSHSQNANPAVFETVAELQVNTSSFSAQYGIGGAIFNQITKGGTSQFHGAAYDYLQNDALAAYQYGFGAPHSALGAIPHVRYNNFGASVGGPILKHKMFFYFDYDQIVDHGNATAFNSVPTTAVMAGDFTGMQTIFDPTTQTMATDSKGNSYPIRKSFASEYGGGNAIPSSLFDPVAAKFQQFYPTPSNHIAGGAFVPGNLGSEGELQNNFYASLQSSSPYRKYFGRLDYDITPNNRLTTSDTQSDTPQMYPSDVTACPVGCQAGDVDNNNAQVTDVWNISSRTINEARMGFTSQLNFFADLALNHGYAAKLGWQFAKADDFPAINFAGTYPYAWIDPSSNAVYKEFTYDPSDVVTMIRGKHILHFGGEFLTYQNNSTAWGNTNAGTMQFSGQYTQQWAVDANGVAGPVPGTGMEYADFLLGYAQSWNANVSPEYGGRFRTPQVFIQDDWKMRPNLTVNLGLRYQINHGWNEVHNNEASFDPTITNPATNTPGAYWFGTTHTNGRTALMADVYNTFQPRVGFSWQPHPNTTLNGGFGIYSYTWSLDTYGGNNTTYGMGAAISAAGNVSDQSNGITPITQLGGAGTIFGTANALPYNAASNAPTAYNGQGVGYNQYHTPVPRILQWNFSLQRAFGSDLSVELAYVASHGSGLNFPTDINAIPENALSVSDANNCGSGTTVNCAEPYPIFLGLSGSTNNAITNYNSLQASIKKRMRNGLSFDFNYVWSHMLDDIDSSGWGSRAGPQSYQDAFHPSANYGSSNFDVRNAFKGYAVYELPVGRGKKLAVNNGILDGVVGGWQLAGTLVLSTGNPFNVDASQNTFQQAGTSYPNWVQGVSWKPAHQTITNWFNPGAFSQPANGTFGNVRRNSLYGPGIDEVNLSGSKTFSIWENIKLQIRADAQNAFNHPSFGVPGDASLGGSAGPGTPYTTGTTVLNTVTVYGRNVQLGARLTY